MEISEDEKQQAIPEVTKAKGGLRTMPFIIANEAFEKLASVGLHANMILYLKDQYHLTNATGINVLFVWGALSNFTPILGAFVSDSYLGRFRVIAVGTVITLLGMIILWLTAIIPSARPPYCMKEDPNCKSPTAAQLIFLFLSFIVMAIGGGGIRPCSLAFGADQFDKPEDPKNETTLQTFFNWYYASVGISIMISVIVVVSIQQAAGWVVGFGIPVGFMLLSTIMFLWGSSLYVKVRANKSLLTSFAQVISAAWKKKHLALLPRDSDKWYYQKGSKLVVPTKKISVLNKACVIKDPEKDMDNDGLAIDPWNLCTVKQVEELKALIKVLPIWSTGIIQAVTISQHSFPVLQAQSMDRHFVGKVQIPAASYGVFVILSLTLWVAIYDRLLVPWLAKITKRPRGLTNKERMGIGIFLSIFSTAVAGIVEHKRRTTAFREGLADDRKAVLHMSANWLLPQHCLTGIAEAFNAIGQIEFYYSQFPKTMSSIAVSLFSLGMGVGNLVGGLIVMIVGRVTGKGGRVSWLSNNLNRGHYDYYYWVLSILCVVNFFYYLVCSWAYGREDSRVWDEGEAMEDEDVQRSMVGSPIVL